MPPAAYSFFAAAEKEEPILQRFAVQHHLGCQESYWERLRFRDLVLARHWRLDLAKVATLPTFYKRRSFMNILEAIRSRRVVKNFDPAHRITHSKQRELLMFIMQAPTAFNVQHWRFFAVENPKLRQALSPDYKAIMRHGHALMNAKICRIPVLHIIGGSLQRHRCQSISNRIVTRVPGRWGVSVMTRVAWCRRAISCAMASPSPHPSPFVSARR